MKEEPKGTPRIGRKDQQDPDRETGTPREGAFDHDAEEAVRVRVRLMRELAATREPPVAAHVSFPYGRVAVAGDVFRWAPAYWDY